MTDWATKSLTAASTALEGGELKAADLTKTCLDLVKTRQSMKAFLRLNANAEVEAEASDRRRQSGKALGALDGIPIALKDNLVTHGLETTSASKILNGWIPPYDAHVVQKLQAAGAINLGKTNLDEFSMGSSCEHSAFGRTEHPHVADRVPGGSSGGSAAAVAAGLCFGALGSDTGGSIRQPAAFCGVLGIKPTYGRVSRYGLIAFASSLDQIGTFARSSKDLAILTQAIAGFDQRDATSVDRPVPDWTGEIDQSMSGLKIGRVRPYFDAVIEPEIAERCEEQIAKMVAQGATVVDVDLPHSQFALPAYYIIAPAEASSNLSRFDGVRYGPRADASQLDEMYARTRYEGFGPEVRRRIALGTFVLSAGYKDAYYTRAQQVRTLVRRDFERAFNDVDLLVGPTTPTTAFKAGDRTSDPLAMYKADVLTVAANLAGIPAASVPAGNSQEGLPIGIQLMAPWWDEGAIFRAAHALETN